MSVVTVTLCLLACIATVLSRPDINIESRIVGGQNAGIGQFPHQVSLRQNNQHYCGGSIISPLKVLTAAHCIYGQLVTLNTAVVGTNTLNSGGVSYLVLSGTFHTSYDPQTLINDVAVLTLALPILYNQYVQPINLATSSPSPGETLTLSGWGLTSYPGSTPNDLQYINLQSLDLQSCAESLQGTSPISTGHVCTTSPAGQGACQGDSGGPLINAAGVQVGIVSWGVPCAVGYPDVFSSVAFYYSWIESH
ncbi:chymotrypsin-1-like [Bradysia coprophila]|uniref:chymotrypsin-1-like n=1 Tax=Bradysia coprophila TaxID=38358 RepID=UPI00187D8655|nr:chymotrypsin-1-like [Bradysia coprophila]